MKRINLLFICIVATLFATIIVIGCKKTTAEEAALNSTQEITSTTNASINESQTEALFNDVYDNVMGYQGNNFGTANGIGIFSAAANDNFRTDTFSLSSCIKIIVDQPSANGYPKTVTIDFGNDYCATVGGRLKRKGKIITVYTGRIDSAGASATTTFENYYIDSVKIEGTHTIINQSTAGVKKYNVKITGGRVTQPNGNYTLYNKDYTNTQTQGTNTISPADDAFEITGNSSGEFKMGADAVKKWSSTITEPLVRKFTCPWFLTGKVTINRPSGQTALIDYAPTNNGSCDMKASVTINGETKIINIGR
jgi:hypothetical protein